MPLTTRADALALPQTRPHDKRTDAEPASQSVQLKGGLKGLDFAEQEAKLAPPTDAAKTTQVPMSIAPGKLNVIGENHPESGARRADEIEMVKTRGFVRDQYWTENAFTFTGAAAAADGGQQDVSRSGDDRSLLVVQSLSFALEELVSLEGRADQALGAARAELAEKDKDLGLFNTLLAGCQRTLTSTLAELEQTALAVDEWRKDQTKDPIIVEIDDAIEDLRNTLDQYQRMLPADCEADELEEVMDDVESLSTSCDGANMRVTALLRKLNYADPSDAAAEVTGKEGAKQLSKQIVGERSLHMFMAAEASGKTGVWKVGDEHLADMKGVPAEHINVIDRDEFNRDFLRWKAQQVPVPNRAPASPGSKTSEPA